MDLKLNIKNKGKFLETIIDNTNNQYYENNDLIVTKIPVPINIINTVNNIVTKGKFSESKNCDYIGIYKGIYFEFEAKETSKEFFNWNNISKNQQVKLNRVSQNGGISFIIIYFHNHDTYFMTKYDSLLNYINEFTQKIPYFWFLQTQQQISLNGSIYLDYKKYLINLIV